MLKPIIIEYNKELKEKYKEIKSNFGSHPNSTLKKEWKEFSHDNFVFEVISEIKQDDKQIICQKEVKLLEVMFIEELKPFGENLYNEV